MPDLIYPPKPRPGDKVAVVWSLGIVGFHGGSVMVEFGRPGEMHPMTASSLRAALFTSGEYDLVSRGCGTEGKRFPWVWHRGEKIPVGVTPTGNAGRVGVRVSRSWRG